MVKKYWELFSGAIVGLALSFMAHFDGEKVQMIYYVIILMLVCMGMFSLIRQAVDKGKKKREKREHNLLDGVVDAQIAVRACRLAQEPMKEGERVGKLFINILEVNKKIMKKLKELFGKYKGYLLTLLLGVLTAVENFGGYINSLCGGKLTFKGVEVLPLVTLLATVIVGILSNGYTKEQMQKIKALFSKSDTDELIQAEIKKSIKDNSAKHSQFTKILATKETELENLQSEFESLNNTFQAKKGMYNMTPQLASEEDVQLAYNALKECETKINNKSAEIEDVKRTIANLATTINALKSQL